ncbi:MAG: hypothetical protein JNM50_15055 [Chromatiales bacterium]|jgi:hypothetical protein|nr:hypothetical protein [Chromatiales bacterium]
MHAVHRPAVPLLSIMVLWLCIAPPATGQVTQLQVNRLEQDVRDLRRELEMQRRRIEEMERAAATGPRPPRVAGARPGTAGASTGQPAPATAQWLSAGSWEKVRPGLSELEVVALLGQPTSMRTSDDGRRRTLFYALEIGSAGYLAGNVVLQAGQVTAVEIPRLR